MDEARTRARTSAEKQPGNAGTECVSDVGRDSSLDHSDDYDYDYDAIVIGSGFAGAVTACRLVEAGLRICIVERGRRFGPEDLPIVPIDEREPPSDFTRFGWNPGRGLLDFRDLGDVAIAQAAGFGGGSLIYANVHLRAPEEVFASWPESIDAEVLAPHYDVAAYMLQVSTAPQKLKLRKTRAFQDATKGMGHAFDTPLAVQFDESVSVNPISGRAQGACDLRGECLLGCGAQAKNTLDLNYLALAEDAGATVRTLCEVVGVVKCEVGYEVEYIDHLTGATPASLRSRYVFLCAGSVNTTELMMRSRELAGLPVEGCLGAGYFPNADDVAVVYEADNYHEMDRGPTITSAVVHERDGQWMMLQDGGLPTEFLPWLGTFRSPLLMSRNRFRDQETCIRQDREGHGFADLPAASSMINALSELLQDPNKDNESRWSILPDQLHRSLDAIRLQSLAELAAALEPTVASAMQASATDSELAKRIDAIQADQDAAQRYEALPAMAIELAIRMAFGSQSGLAQFLATELIDRIVPWGDRLTNQVVDFLTTILDYRYLDGHASVLLSMGRDSRPGVLSLEWTDVASKGAIVCGRLSGARALVLVDSILDAERTHLLVSPLAGRLQRGESIELDGRDFGRCCEIEPVAGGAIVSEHAPLASLEVLRVEVERFQIGSASREPATARGSRLALRMPGISELPERALTKRLMRDAAQTVGGELRTNPLWAGFGKRVSVHSQGGCPMSDDPSQGVCKPSGEVHGCEGLYVMDAAAFPGPVGVNPSATILALAEWKCERFIRDVLGQADWTPAQRETATRWADLRRPMLDPLARERRPATPTDPPRSQPIGIAFHERMVGRLLPAGGSRADVGAGEGQTSIELDLDVSIEDLERLISSQRSADPIHAVVAGEVRLVGDTSGFVGATGERPDSGSLSLRIDSSVSRLGLFVDPDARGLGPRYRSLAYWLELESTGKAAANERFLLAGRKRAQPGAEGEVWSELSTLPFELARVGDPASNRSGLVRLPAAVFVGEQLKGMRATGTSDPAQQTWALVAFTRFFMGNVIDLYGPKARRAREWIERMFGEPR